MNRHYLMLYLLLITTTLSYGSLFVERPQNVTLFLNESATFDFTCVTEISTVTLLNIFYHNGSQIHFPGDSAYHRETKTGSNGESLGVYGVKIVTRLAYNGSMIRCTTYTVDSGGDRETAYGLMLLQGPPEAVTDFKIAESVSEVVVLWQAPFTLDVTDVEYDITYSLLISNITYENQPTPVTCDLCHNLTLTHFVFSPPHSLPGHSFNFTVTPQNGAGTGPPSDTLTATLTHDIPSNSTSSTAPGTPDTGPSNRDTGSSSVISIISGTLAVVAVLCILAIVLILLCCCVRFKWFTRQSRTVAACNTLYGSDCPDQLKKSEGLELSSTIYPESAPVTGAEDTCEKSVATEEELSTPRDVRKRHKQGSHSPEETKKEAY